MPSDEESDYITARRVQQRAFVPMTDTRKKPTNQHAKLFLTKLVARWVWQEGERFVHKQF